MKIGFSTFAFAGAAVLALGALATSQLMAFGNGPVPNQQPNFTENTPCNIEFVVTPGQQLCFNVTSVDPEGDFIILTWNNVPITATTNPPTVVGGQGIVSTTFCYTATPAEVGQNYLVVFTTEQPGNTLPTNKCDIRIRVETGLSAELSTFTGKVAFENGPVMLNWETSSEIDNAFFNVYRSTSTFNNAIQINNAPIVAKGGPAMPAAYKQLDRRVATGSAYFYWLEAVDIFGGSQLFGPIEVVAR